MRVALTERGLEMRGEKKPLELLGRAGKDEGIGKPKKWAVVLVK